MLNTYTVFCHERVKLKVFRRSRMHFFGHLHMPDGSIFLLFVLGDTFTVSTQHPTLVNSSPQRVTRFQTVPEKLRPRGSNYSRLHNAKDFAKQD